MISSRRFSILVLALLTAPVVAAPASAARHASPASGSTTVVINEVAPQGPGSAADEFIEVRNISKTTQNIGGFQLVACNVNGTTATLFTFPSPTVLARKGQLGQFRLVVNSTGYSRVTPPDFSYTSAVGEIQATGGLMLVSGTVKIDGVGFLDSLPCTEPPPAMPPGPGQSSSRNAQSRDTDNNFADFSVGSPTPQNQFS